MSGFSALRVQPLSIAAAFLAGTLMTPLFLAVAGILPAFRFTRERIEVTVRSSAIDVNGLYVYSNPWPVPWTQGLVVPFPVDAAHPAPATAEVTEIDPETGVEVRAIPLVWIGGRPHFTVGIPAFGTMYVRVRFTQPCASSSATYLLTTTRPWRRPLERGEYVLLPRGVRITESNYELNARDQLGFARNDFMPDKEWMFTWRSE
jgi:hypothetical protein